MIQIIRGYDASVASPTQLTTPRQKKPVSVTGAGYQTGEIASMPDTACSLLISLGAEACPTDCTKKSRELSEVVSTFRIKSDRANKA